MVRVELDRVESLGRVWGLWSLFRVKDSELFKSVSVSWVGVKHTSLLAQHSSSSFSSSLEKDAGRRGLTGQRLY